jgi:outer membrane receptor protein involved in Fe transport
MNGSEYKTGLAIVLISFLGIQAYPQQITARDSLYKNIPPQFQIKPILHYSIGSTFLAVPHRGSVTGFTFTPELSLPLSPKFSINGGFIAGRYYSNIGNINPEGVFKSTYNALSVYASASYHFNPQLTLYGAVYRQLAGPSPVNFLPKTSYTLGSTYKFGSFSIGVSVHMSDWYNYPSPFPANGSDWLYPPFMQSQGTMMPWLR